MSFVISPKLSYDDALAYIASLAPRGWRLGLDRMAEFARKANLPDALGSPGGPQYIHIAGTNGKGTVTAFVQSILVEHGYRTGAFFSPFVYDPRERIQFGRDYIPEQAMADLTARLIPIAEAFSQTEFGGITEFEFKTALGFLFWKEMKCDWVALEVGLGGRLDATNIIIPRAAVVTSISLDHTSVLGGTHAEIAFEKAGIVKAGVPVVTGQLGEDASRVVGEAAAHAGSQLWRLGHEVLVENSVVTTPGRTYDDLQPALKGKYVPANMAVAIAALEAAGVDLDSGSVQRGVHRATLPGRFELRCFQGRQVVLDGAHNAEAAEALRESLSETFPECRLVLITGMVQGHDPLDFYGPLLKMTSAVHIAPIDFHRAVDPADLERVLRPRVANTHAHCSVGEAIDAAMVDCEPDDILLVTGSFYLVGEVGKQLTNLGDRQQPAALQ
jgi:dihydrofolate synthase / folylpolyglutamate synthase